MNMSSPRRRHPPPPSPQTIGTSDSSAQRKKSKFGLKRLFKRKKNKKTTSGDNRSVQFAENEQQEKQQQQWAQANQFYNAQQYNTTASSTPTPPTTTTTTQSPNNNNKNKTSTTTTANNNGASTSSTLKSSASDRVQSLPKSWLARTRFFRTMVEQAFDDIDADGSGDIDEKELYSGLLLIHLKLGAYAGPAACKPISRDKCHAVFLKMDTDGSGRLDKEEFSQVMMVLFGNVMMRVLFQYAATLMIVPVLAKTILDILLYISSFLPWLLQQMDPYTPVDEIVETYWKQLQGIIVEKSPNVLLKISSSTGSLLEKIPESVWNTIPLTLLSTLLSMMIIPWTLMKIDDYFQSMADRKGKDDNKKQR